MADDDYGNYDSGYGISGSPDPGTYALPGGGSDGSFWNNLFSGLSKNTIAGLLGGLGPTAGLIGTLTGGGKGATQTGSSNQSQSNNQSGNSSTVSSGTQTGTRNSTTSSTRQDQQAGFSDTTSTPHLDQAGADAEGRLNALLGGNAGGAQAAYSKALSMLDTLTNGEFSRMNAGPGAGPNTSPTPTATGNFPTQLPTDYNAGLGNLIKQAFGSFTGDLASGAINNARARGFNGGADLLGTAAAPMMGQGLAQVPAMEAKAYLDHVLQAYDLQSQNASRESGANAAAMNAGTAALGPGIQKYGIDRSADNAQIGNMTSLLQALMGPQREMMAGNTALLNAAPRATTQNTLTGSSGLSSLSGVTDERSSSASNSSSNTASNSSSNSLSQGNTTGTTQTPLGPQIGQGAASIGQGIATGVAAQDARDSQAAFQKSLMDMLARRG